MQEKIRNQTIFKWALGSKITITHTAHDITIVSVKVNPQDPELSQVFYAL